MNKKTLQGENVCGKCIWKNKTTFYAGKTQCQARGSSHTTCLFHLLRIHNLCIYKEEFGVKRTIEEMREILILAEEIGKPVNLDRLNQFGYWTLAEQVKTNWIEFGIYELKDLIERPNNT